MKQSLPIFTFIFTLFFSSLSTADTFNQVHQDYLISQKGNDYKKTVDLAEKLVDLAETKYA
ncbi:MAG: hypothetical protein ACJAV1_001195 [Paraglaciecola sp.]|jgi:hypothetical protein